MNVGLVERERVSYLPLNPEDPESWRCESCGFEMCSFSPTPKPTYRRVSEQDPNELRRSSLRQDRQAEAAIALQKRQTAAPERLAEHSMDAHRIATLEAQIEALTARLEAQNVHESDEAPEPPRPQDHAALCRLCAEPA